MTNPILAFGAKRRMRTFRTPLLLTLYSVLLVAVAYFAVYAPFLKGSIRLDTMHGSVIGYDLMVMLQFGLLVLVAPAMTAGSISGERERQTMDLLLVTNTGTGHILVGKLLESFGFLALMVLCSLPVLSLALLTGGATFLQVLVSVLFLLITSLAGLSVGLFCSTIMKRTVTATVTAYLMMLAIGVVTLIPLWYDVHRLDLLYTEMNTAGTVMTQINYQSIAFSTNPALGLFSMLQDQNHMFSSALWYFSYTLGNTIDYLPLDRYAAANMIFMTVCSGLLCLIAALRLRSRKEPKRKGRVTK